MRGWGSAAAMLLAVTGVHAQVATTVRNCNISPQYSWSRFCSGEDEFRKDQQVVLYISEASRLTFRDTLRTCGLSIREYLAPNVWLCFVQKDHRLNRLQGLAGISGVGRWTTANKLDPAFAVVHSDSITEARVLGFMDEPAVFLLNRLNRQGINAFFSADSFIHVRCRPELLNDLAARLDVVYIEMAPSGPYSLNHGANWLHRSRILQQSNNRGLTGNDVVIAIGDEARINFHPDYQNRVSRTTTATPSTTHAHQVSGTAFGAGIIQEHLNGMAPGASALSDQYFIPLVTTGTYKNLYGMNMTNNSYAFGAGSTCSPLGTYGSNASQADRISRQYTTIAHIVASGNSGGLNCSPYPAGFATIAEGYQNAKNVITVGNVTDQDVISGSSSRGPVKDGRIKPDVVAKGQFVTSTIPPQGYTTGSGTSFASPGAAGIMALMYQRFRQLNSGADPDATYMKAVLLNTAKDLGNAGPDYTFGYGRVDALRAVESIESGQFRTGSLSGNDSVSYSITVPAGTGELRVLLCWADTTPSSAAAVALVNNLDLRVIAPGGTVYQPWILNTTPANANNTATRGTDNLNNVEQVTIDLPSSGTYTLRINGTAVPFGPQKFWLVFEHKARGVRLTSPFPGEAYLTGTNQYVHYDGFGINTGTYTIQYSADSGSTWTNITTTASATSSVFGSWTTPTTAGNKYLVRIFHNSLGFGDTVDATFTMLAKPVISSVSSCGNQAVITWSAITGATDYEVFRLINNNWQTVGYTTGTSFRVGGLTPGDREWFSLRARIGKATGRRADGVTVVIANTTCSVSGDVGVHALISPLYGRAATSARLTTSQQIVIRLKNYGNSTVSSFPVYYRINGNAAVNQTYSGTITANDTVRFTFSTTANLSAAGVYRIRLWTTLPGDANSSNDTITCWIRNAANPALTLPWLQNFEAASDTSVLRSMFVLNGADQVDFLSSLQDGRFRTFAGPGTVRGRRALIMDKLYSGSSFNQNFTYITTNLSGYTSGARLLLSFALYLNGETSHTGDSVWVRGADTLPWIPLLHLSSTGYPRNNWLNFSNINVSSALSSRGQSPGASTQFRFGQYDSRMQRTMFDSAGIMIDNFYLTNAPVDIQLNAVSSPATKCGQGTDSVRITLRNNGNSAASNIPVFYRLDGGTAVRDTFKSSLASGATANFTFRIPVTINDINAHRISVWCGLPADGFSTNDTVNVASFRFLPRVNTFPFLDDFEGSQQFFTEGIRNSWEWGTPNSYHITGAASGTKAWATGLRTEHNQVEESYLYSPCFDLSSVSGDVRLSFHATHHTDNSSGYFNGYRTEYSEDGNNWFVLGTGTGQYNNYNVGSPFFYWNGTRNGYKVVGQTIPVSSMTNKSGVRFRIYFFSDYGTLRDGPTIDDWHIFDDATGVYNGSTTTANATGSGSAWLHFGSGSTRYFSVRTGGSSLGSTTAGVHVFGGSTRIYNNQYTMNRNWWILPANGGTGSYTVRLYYREPEADNLSGIDPVINDFRDFGVTKYSGPAEDSLFTNDSICQPCFSFFPPARKVVPYFDGQYLEIGTTSLSEFWINGGTTSRLIPLPIEPVLLSAKRMNKAGELSWRVSDPCRYRHFELFRCDDSSCNTRLTELTGRCGEYVQTFTDLQAPESMTRYRLVATEPETGISVEQFASIPALHAETGLTIMPNPGEGPFSILTGAVKGKGKISIYNAAGQLVYSKEQEILPFTTHDFNLTSLPEGLYLLNMTIGQQRFTEKLVIQKN